MFYLLIDIKVSNEGAQFLETLSKVAYKKILGTPNAKV